MDIYIILSLNSSHNLDIRKQNNHKNGSGYIRKLAEVSCWQDVIVPKTGYKYYRRRCVHEMYSNSRCKTIERRIQMLYEMLKWRAFVSSFIGSEIVGPVLICNPLAEGTERLNINVNIRRSNTRHSIWL